MVKWTEDKLSQISSMLDEGKTVPEIAKHFSVTRGCMRQVMVRANLLGRQRNKRKRFWTNERLEDLRNLVEQGKSGAQIADHFDTTTYAVYVRAHTLGLDINCQETTEKKWGAPRQEWSHPSDTKRLASLMAQGMSIRAAAKAMKRTAGTVKYRGVKHGIIPSEAETTSLRKQGLKRCPLCKMVRENTKENFRQINNRSAGCVDCLQNDLESAIKVRHSRTKTQSKTRGVKFNLTVEYLTSLYRSQEGKCYYTGREMTIRSGKDPTALSLDKINPTAGYVEGNVVWCAHAVNVMKYTMNLDELKDWCQAVLNHVQ